MNAATCREPCKDTVEVKLDAMQFSTIYLFILLSYKITRFTFMV
jgi:hypothetical protein